MSAEATKLLVEKFNESLDDLCAILDYGHIIGQPTEDSECGQCGAKGERGKIEHKDGCIGRELDITLNDWRELAESIKTLRRERRRLREAIFLLLKSRDCWAHGEPEIPDELSAQFDISLTLARRIVNLVTGKEQAELNV